MTQLYEIWRLLHQALQSSTCTPAKSSSDTASARLCASRLTKPRRQT